MSCAQWTEPYKEWIKIWLPQWNMFLQARAGKILVTRLNLCLTIVGFIFYIADLVSDITASIFYASNGKWWQAIITLAFVYGTVIIHTVIKWRRGQIHYTGSADCLHYVGLSLVNWPDLKQYAALCLLEWNVFKLPKKNARLVPELQRRRYNVAYLKFMEGFWEACPQTILQIYLLEPDLYGVWTWTDCLRIAGISISLCTAGAALVNREKSRRIANFTDVTLSELVVLHVWAVPVTVSRLLSVGLLLSIYSSWTLTTGAAPDLTYYRGVQCGIMIVPRVRVNTVIAICLVVLQFFLSPFNVAASITYRRVAHAIHFVGNTAATVMWALCTPLLCKYPALYTCIICVNPVIFAVGLLGWQLHEKYWRR